MNEKPKMSPMAKTEMKNVVKALDPEEQLVAVRSLPNELLIQEIQRRLETATSMLTSITAIINGKEQETHN